MKSTILSIAAAIAIIGGAIWLTKNGGTESGISFGGTTDNVTIADGVQTIELKAKGGYRPRATVATAGIPTVLRVNTTGTYDCSAAIRIPSLSIAKMLPPNGTSDLDLGTPEKGKLFGTCGMGMYNFQVQFQ